MYENSFYNLFLEIIIKDEYLSCTVKAMHASV